MQAPIKNFIHLFNRESQGFLVIYFLNWKPVSAMSVTGFFYAKLVFKKDYIFLILRNHGY